ncbi:MAG TPA: zinc ABC transporter substrate-binding protein, partial [Leclercia adecarboxylata]|nr:zinc ABC transporter substrate-binding protein [Leclercia adecarboxylata]
MKRALIFAALLALFSPLACHTAEASSASISLAPGVTLNLGDRDNRGNYWDGGRWREPRWWNDRYTYNERRWWRHEEWR